MVTVFCEALYPGGYAIAKKDERVLDIIKRSGGTTDEADIEAINVTRNQLVIPIDWKLITKKPNSTSNLIIQVGDTIRIPNKKSTVLISGDVMFETEVPFIKGKNVKYYIKNAGGAAEKGWMKKVYVVHANGSASASGSVFGIRKYPKVFAGSKIIVPAKPEKTKASTGEIVGIASVLTSLAGILLAVFK
jgi:protein involved in polysaccharide export with SLBB domain